MRCAIQESKFRPRSFMFTRGLDSTKVAPAAARTHEQNQPVLSDQGGYRNRHPGENETIQSGSDVRASGRAVTSPIAISPTGSRKQLVRPLQGWVRSVSDPTYSDRKSSGEKSNCVTQFRSDPVRHTHPRRVQVSSTEFNANQAFCDLSGCNARLDIPTASHENLGYRFPEKTFI